MVNQLSTKDDVDDVERGGAKDGARSEGRKDSPEIKIELPPSLAG